MSVSLSALLNCTFVYLRIFVFVFLCIRVFVCLPGIRASLLTKLLCAETAKQGEREGLPSGRNHDAQSLLYKLA